MLFRSLERLLDRVGGEGIGGARRGEEVGEESESGESEVGGREGQSGEERRKEEGSALREQVSTSHRATNEKHTSSCHAVPRFLTNVNSAMALLSSDPEASSEITGAAPFFPLLATGAAASFFPPRLAPLTASSSRSRIQLAVEAPYG